MKINTVSRFATTTCVSGIERLAGYEDLTECIRNALRHSERAKSIWDKSFDAPIAQPMAPCGPVTPGRSGTSGTGDHFRRPPNHTAKQKGRAKHLLKLREGDIAKGLPVSPAAFELTFDDGRRT